MTAIGRSAFLVSFCLLAAVACSRDATFTEPIPPNAAIHWVEAVPDTMQEDMRVIDMVSNAGLYDADFRGSTLDGTRIGIKEMRGMIVDLHQAAVLVQMLGGIVKLD